VIEFVGYLASAGAIAMWLPQVTRAYLNRTNPAYTHAISASAYSVAIAFNALLIVYGTMSNSIPAVCAGAVNLVCAALIVGLKATA
jgi:hypothetical protein